MSITAVKIHRNLLSRRAHLGNNATQTYTTLHCREAAAPQLLNNGVDVDLEYLSASFEVMRN